jgi:hypothetical protein
VRPRCAVAWRGIANAAAMPASNSRRLIAITAGSSNEATARLPGHCEGDVSSLRSRLSAGSVKDECDDVFGQCDGTAFGCGGSFGALACDRRHALVPDRGGG